MLSGMNVVNISNVIAHHEFKVFKHLRKILVPLTAGKISVS